MTFPAVQFSHRRVERRARRTWLVAASSRRSFFETEAAARVFIGAVVDRCRAGVSR